MLVNMYNQYIEQGEFLLYLSPFLSLSHEICMYVYVCTDTGIHKAYFFVSHCTFKIWVTEVPISLPGTQSASWLLVNKMSGKYFKFKHSFDLVLKMSSPMCS